MIVRCMRCSAPEDVPELTDPADAVRMPLLCEPCSDAEREQRQERGDDAFTDSFDAFY